MDVKAGVEEREGAALGGIKRGEVRWIRDVGVNGMERNVRGSVHA